MNHSYHSYNKFEITFWHKYPPPPSNPLSLAALAPRATSTGALLPSSSRFLLTLLPVLRASSVPSLLTPPSSRQWAFQDLFEIIGQRILHLLWHVFNYITSSFHGSVYYLVFNVIPKKSFFSNFCGCLYLSNITICMWFCLVRFWG